MYMKRVAMVAAMVLMLASAAAQADEPAGTSFPVTTPEPEALEVNAAEDAGCPDPNAISVYWKEGLRFDTCDKKFRFKFGGRVFWDATVWNANQEIETALGEDLRNGTEFRAARLYLSGQLYEDFVFKAEYDFANDEGADFKDVYVGVENLLVEGSELLLGNSRVPFSLEDQTSSRFTTFMERGLPNAFANGREPGVHVSTPWLDDRLYTAISVSQTADDDQASHAGNDVNVTSRIVGVPYVDGDDRVIHLGVAHSYQKFENSEARYRQRPEVHDSPYFVDTGDFEADDAHIIGAEAAAVFGPISVQGEYMRSFVDGDAGDDPEFSGYYVYGSWFLTGEHRNYKLGDAKFDRVAVERNVLAKGGGFGAWEVAARYSHLDLDDKYINGGTLDDVTAGLNWYLNPNMRVMFNYIHTDLEDVDDTDAFVMRTQVDF